jgi:thiamine transporter ThiT
MITDVLVTERKYSPPILKFWDVRSYIFTAVFVSLSVATPWLFHQFNLAGATFLPMFFFIFIAGLIFGWRAGLAVGMLTPLFSYGISRMPVLNILPQVVIEAAVFGLTAGLLREKLNLRFFWALLGAMFAGFLALFVFVLARSLFNTVYNPLGASGSPYSVVWTTIKQGWPGLAIQLAVVPFIAAFLEKRLAKKF